VSKEYGVVKPSDPSLWSDELDKHLGKIYPEDDFVPSVDEGWLILGSLEDDVYGDILFPVGDLIHESCLIELPHCSCKIKDIWRNGCRCGSMAAEKEFRKRRATEK
jgi:hypothetical protein